MHRFYAFHSFSMFHRNSIAAAAFFLAAKVRHINDCITLDHDLGQHETHRCGALHCVFVYSQVEEQPRKLEHVIKIHNICLEKNEVSREAIAELTQELVFHENILLQTLGFDVAIDHP